jgi:ADP-heptose:LPS heptosyltransferase
LKRILVIQTASIGDVILATPVLEAINSNLPEYKIDILVKGGMEGLFLSHPFVNDILVWNKSEKKYRNLFHLILKVRKRHYSYVITLQRFFSSGLITALSGSKMTIGFQKNPLSAFFKYRVPHEIRQGLHETERNLQLLQPLNLAAGKPVMKLYPSARDIDLVEKLKKRAYITISPASLWFTKQFPIEKWISFLNSIPAELVVYILGSKQDQKLANNIIEKSEHQEIHSLCGELKLLESAALMKNAVMNYTNDSAPMHLASSVDAPVTAIFCSTTPDFGFGPLSAQSIIVEALEIPACKPCGLHGYSTCPEKHFNCALNIHNDQLLFSLRQ